MEPFRPLVDFVIKKISNQNITFEELTPEIKRKISGILTIDLSTQYGIMPLSSCLLKLSQSLVKSFENKEVLLDIPLSMLPIELENNE